jgi:hypothetical protein
MVEGRPPDKLGVMKKSINQSCRALLLTGTLLTASTGFAQTSEMTTTTTNSVGTIKTFDADTMTISTGTSPDPIAYSYSKTTTYVDEAGAPVAMETVKSGLPVTVYYTKVDGNMVATKVIVRKVVVVPVAPVVVEKKTTTTTETTE